MLNCQKIKLKKTTKVKENNCPQIEGLHNSLITTTHRNCTCSLRDYAHIAKFSDSYSVFIFSLAAFDTIDHLLFETLFDNKVITVYFILIHCCFYHLVWNSLTSKC